MTTINDLKSIPYGAEFRVLTGAEERKKGVSYVARFPDCRFRKGVGDEPDVRGGLAKMGFVGCIWVKDAGEGIEGRSKRGWCGFPPDTLVELIEVAQ
jgi:hypothetical protein